MRRLLAILLAIFLSPLIGRAQISFDPGEGCLNVVDFTAGKGLGSHGSNLVSLQYLHERLLGEQLSVGLGTGYTYLDSYKFSAIPLLLSSHYFLMDERLSPYINLRAGVYLPVGADSEQSGFNLYVSPSAGIKMHMTPYIGILASLGYDCYRVKAFDPVRNDYHARMASAIGFSIGVCFQIPGW